MKNRIYCSGEQNAWWFSFSIVYTVYILHLYFLTIKVNENEYLYLGFMVSLHPCVVFSARNCVWRLLPPVSPIDSCMCDIPLLLRRGDFSPLSCGAPIQPQNRSQPSGQGTATPTKHICHAQILALSLVFLCFLPFALLLQCKCQILGKGAEMYSCSPQVGSE